MKKLIGWVAGCSITHRVPGSANGSRGAGGLVCYPAAVGRVACTANPHFSPEEHMDAKRSATTPA